VIKKKQSICIIPIKSFSQRVKNKNFKFIGKKPLFKIIIEKIIKAKCFDEIIIDSDSDVIKKFCSKINIKYIDRHHSLKKVKTNGNDILNYWMKKEPNYDTYFLAHVTSPFVKTISIKQCVKKFLNNSRYNSVFTATKEFSWYWFKNKPINFKKYKLCRSQDLTPVIRDTTFLYGISKKEFIKKKSRIGSKPLIYYLDEIESVDINNEFDFFVSRNINKFYFN
jgi:CMP-N-acetylneuraminic acid synthetase